MHGLKIALTGNKIFMFSRFCHGPFCRTIFDASCDIFLRSRFGPGPLLASGRRGNYLLPLDGPVLVIRLHFIFGKLSCVKCVK